MSAKSREYFLIMPILCYEKCVEKLHKNFFNFSEIFQSASNCPLLTFLKLNHFVLEKS
jgi:hypothetical protein